MSKAALQGTEALSEDLCTRQREILSVVVNEGGHARQKDVVDAVDIGRNQVSEYVQQLACEGHLKKVALGRENILFLPGCEPDILQSTFEGAMYR